VPHAPHSPGHKQPRHLSEPFELIGWLLPADGRVIFGRLRRSAP
jgi:hypothetical protein